MSYLKKGILLKVGTLIAVALGHVIAKPVNLPLGFAFGVLFIIVEAISGWRNLQRAGVAFPRGFFATIDKLEKQKRRALERALGVDDDEKRD